MPSQQTDQTPSSGDTSTGVSSDLVAPDLVAPDLVESYKSSLWLQEMRIASLQQQVRERSIRVHGLEHSLSWRITGPIRVVRALASGRLANGVRLIDAVRRLRDIGASEGARGLRTRVLRRLPAWRGRRPLASEGAKAAGSPLGQMLPALPQLADRVLIIAELSVPQCAKYRVWQKQELFGRLGWPCTVIDWHETEASFSAMQTCTRLIFYRVPAVQSVLEMIAEAKRLGLQPRWEVDDLIFDEPLYRRNSNLATLSAALRAEVLSGIRLYRAAMLACGRAIASTPVLAQAMRDAGIAEVACIENALDEETLAAAQRLRDARAAGQTRREAGVMLVYGSGTKTHDADFAVAAPAIERLLHAHPGLRLRIIGDLTLPSALDRFAARIEELPTTNYGGYLKLLSEGDIAIAPLEATLFNDAKSNIKFQEAAILAMPCVCSPRAAFAGIVVGGQNGMLAEGDGAWEDALHRLIIDPELRRRLGTRALDDVLQHYAPDHIARTQLLPLFGAAPPAIVDAPRARLRVLMTNVFLWPRSFGGATIVAEQMARQLHARGDTEISVFTSRGEHERRPDALLRYDWDGIAVFASPLPPGGDSVATFDNPAAVRHFAAVLDALRPDVVHAHSIQGFGAGILRLCHERGIPYVITLHDAWWLCERQFMVRGDGNYCFQTRIDLRVCQACVPHARHLQSRAAIMRQVLASAAYLLCPSASHRQLYLANGIAASAIGVNRNGIGRPRRPRRARIAGSRPRLGFVGGNETIKGFHLIRRAFETLASDAWELVLVDNTLNLGFSSIDVAAWKTAGRITVIPAYAQDTMDEFFDRIDVLLFPSQWKESYGLTVREALARDVWVIATEPGGQADDIIDGVNGRLIPLDGRPAGLIAAIEEILLDPAKLDRHSNPARHRLADYDSQAEQLHAVLVQARASSARQAGPRSRDISA